MKIQSIITETKSKIHSQEKFARENFSGLEDIGDQIKQTISDRNEQKNKYREKLRTKRESGEITKEEYFDQLYDDESRSDVDDFEDRLNVLFTVMTIKLSTSIAHALNGKSTTTLKKIVKFMDETGVGEEVMLTNMNTIAQTRSISDNDFMTLSAVVAAQVDDLDFIKQLEKFAEKNKKRDNIFDSYGVPYDFRRYGDFSRMVSIRDKQRVAFEALVSGSENVYKHYKDSISKEYIEKYITTSNYWMKRLTKDEVNNVIQLETDLFDTIVEHMPENLPDYIVDIFIF